MSSVKTRTNLGSLVKVLMLPILLIFEGGASDSFNSLRFRV